MRTKSEARRRAIVDIAAEVFQEVGYAGASMSLISARVGGSKSTIYSYYASKEALFTAVMMAKVVERSFEIADLLEISAEDIPAALHTFANEYVALVSSESSVAILRASISGGFDAKLNSEIYHNAARKTWGHVRRFLQRVQKDGLLQDADIGIMTAHFKGLIEGAIVEPLLFGDEPWVDPKVSTGAAVDVFLRAYGTGALANAASKGDKASAAIA